MLQQTQVSTVREYFIRWMERFPDIKTLAHAEEAEVFKYWQGLGYYSRARNILKTAQIVEKNYSAKFPDTRKELEALPGIGAYTAGAILSLAYHKREAILDGNLVRVFSRFSKLDFLPIDSHECSETYWSVSCEIANHAKGYLHNEALMELGRTVCKSRNPDCESCPLHRECEAYLTNSTQSYPPSKKHLQKDWHGTVLVIESTDARILAVKGGQKFFGNQFALPHFESPKHATVGLPQEAERYVNADSVKSVKHCGTFRHSITVHKMECEVLHIQLSASSSASEAFSSTKQGAPSSASQEFQWIEKARATEVLANSFSLKALKKSFLLSK